MTILNYLTGQHRYRPSRFRNKRNEYPKSWRNAPFSLITSLLRRIPPLRPTLPWLPIEVQQRLDRYFRENPGCICLEYGSGMSTLWLARRCGHVHSVEDSPWWYDRVSEQLAKAGCTNVTYELRQTV